MIHYVTGDATEPVGEGHKIIAHVTNNKGAWGAGFVLALSEKWPEVKEFYLRDHMYLGHVGWMAVEGQTEVANMCAQDGLSGSRKINYAALAQCLSEVAKYADYYASVHMPRIGCGIGGGDWDFVKALIEDTLVKAGVEVYVYDLPAHDEG